MRRWPSSLKSRPHWSWPFLLILLALGISITPRTICLIRARRLIAFIVCVLLGKIKSITLHQLSKINLPYHAMYQCLRRLVFGICIIMSLSSRETPANFFFVCDLQFVMVPCDLVYLVYDVGALLPAVWE